MKKKIIIILSIFILLGLVTDITYSLSTPQNNQNKIENEEKEIKNEEEIVIEEVNNKLNNLTLEEKIAQMLIVTYPGDTYTDLIKEDLETYKPGGVILFKDNITTFDNTVNFISNIENTAKIPLFIGIDEEGGKVTRLTNVTDVNFTKVPPMETLGQTNNPSLAYDTGKVMAEEMRTFHINLDFAPVMDIRSSEKSFIGNRSFGSDATLVSHMALALAQGLIDNDIIPVYKHFPGHGSTVTNSHNELPVIEKTKEELLASDLIPFRQAIDAGADIIMVGHLAIPKITNDLTPASLSKEIITNLLKDELGYDGIVITDALNMKALTNYYSEQEIYEMAINAGVDILLMPSSTKSAIELIKDSLNKGTITIDKIDESVSKILELKYTKINKDYPSKDVIGSSEHQEVINDIN